jgi:hypothetical protein
MISSIIPKNLGTNHQFVVFINAMWITAEKYVLFSGSSWKVKVKFLFFIKYHAVMMYGEFNYSSTCGYFVSALNEAEWSTSRPSHVTNGRRVPITHCLEGRVGHRAGCETCGLYTTYSIIQFVYWLSYSISQNVQTAIQKYKVCVKTRSLVELSCWSN